LKKWQIALVTVLIVVVLFLMDGGQVYVKQLLNRPPKAAFSYRTPTRTLKYIVPTDRDMIMFLNNSSDPDGDPLTSRWYVRYNGTGDWKLFNSSTHHWGRLPVSNEKGHEIRLVVSDGMKEDSTTATLLIDRTTGYSSRKLSVCFKGVDYEIGFPFQSNRPAVSETEMAECLGVIRSELGCNAIKIKGGFDELLVKCAEIAAQKSFELIIVSPRYDKSSQTEDLWIDQHVERVVSFSSKAESLLARINNLILCIGEELQYSTRGFVNASSYDERIDLYGKMKSEERAVVDERLNAYLAKIIKGVRENFHGLITYSPNPMTSFAVKWQELGLDACAPMLYNSDVRQAYKDCLRFKSLGKPVYIAEFGCGTFEGAASAAGAAWRSYVNQPYSQEEQAQYIREAVDVFSTAQVDGIFYWTLILKYDNDARSSGILRYGKNMPAVRKLGFYAYQSFIPS
jgi:hypothetical protein